MRSKPVEGMAVEIKNYRGATKEDKGPIMFVEKVTSEDKDGKAQRVDVMFLNKDWTPYRANFHADAIEKHNKKADA